MIVIGEKINGAIPSVAKAISEKDALFIKNLAKIQTEANADFIDVCASTDVDIEVDTLKWLINLVQEVTDTPICIDSPHDEAIVKAIPYCKVPGLINSVSGEGTKIDTIFSVIAETEWECMALLCDDSGIPKSAEKRIEVFENIMKRAKEFGILPSRLHIDPLVEMLCTSEEGINMIIDVIKEIKRQYPSIHVSGGFSNISFNLPSRKLINQAFCVLVMNAGMDSGILDPTNQDLVGMIYATEALLGQDEFCMEYIGAYRAGLFGQKK